MPRFFAVLAAAALFAAAAPAPTRPGPAGTGTRLHDGWTIAPLGRAADVGNFPMAIAPLPGGRAAVLLAGYGQQGIDVVEIASGSRERIAMPKAWLGLAASSDGRTLYASGGADNVVRVFASAEGEWREEKPFVLGGADAKIFPAGLFLDETRGRLYVCENLANRLAIFDVASRSLLAEKPTGIAPYEVRLDGSARRAFVSNWGDASISAIPIEGDAAAETWPTGGHPTALLLDESSNRLFVACALADRVEALDTNGGRVLWNAAMTLLPGDLEGTTPTSLARAADGRLLVANSNNNDVAVIDVSGTSPKVDGFLPVGRYPTAVAVSGDAILVADAKGSVTRAAPGGPQPTGRIPGSRTPAYVLTRQTGDLRAIPAAELSRLPDHTRTVYAGVPAPSQEKLWPAFSKIRHVIYVIRENRTYDQILGDDRRGDGDPSLVIFGEDVTPNAHAIAKTFALLDNFYCNAEVSADGHNWSSAAFADDYVEKRYPTNYSDRGLPYDFDGGSPLARPRGGYLWDAAARSGASFRSYGWFLDLGANPPRGEVPGLEGRIDPAYHGWDLKYGDSGRADEWLREFREFEKSGDLPALEIVYLPDDHTAGLTPGMRTPKAMAAENDAALGRIVDALTHSRFFATTALFVLEDDAQNGPDHVDCHRSPVLVVSPLTPRGTVDSRMYSTASVLRTIEAILNLSPMSQYDATAAPMAFEFSGRQNLAPFSALAPRVPTGEVNPPAAKGSPAAAELDFTRPDAAPEKALNDALYLGIQGRPSPAPTVRFGVSGRSPGDRDDDD